MGGGGGWEREGEEKEGEEKGEEGRDNRGGVGGERTYWNPAGPHSVGSGTFPA